LGDVTPPPKLALSPPVAIDRVHDSSRFDCGNPALNDWLRKHALRNEAKASRCFVVCEENIIAGFYCLSAGSVSHADVPSALKRNMPPAIPVFVLGRMGVDLKYQGQKLGSHLLRDAMRRALSAARDIGARAILVHAIDQEIVPFYLQYGFQIFPEGSLTLFMPLNHVAAAL
jgi:GNAT superfamily N-acetyltransferase